MTVRSCSRSGARLFTFQDKRVQGFRMHPTGYLFGHQLAISA